MENQFCPYQEKVNVTQYDGNVKMTIICNCAPDRKACPYSKEKKAKVKCEKYRRSIYD